MATADSYFAGSTNTTANPVTMPQSDSISISFQFIMDSNVTIISGDICSFGHITSL
ncbi:hypothetical protein GCM10023093_27710 [Nemorincola caseinilytica]|uniref:Uncharacterized protein n=1 Tax=Nemorincola caseinilytica TaxID=2054315 RepID=A0ABP8NPL2_9BACT